MTEATNTFEYRPAIKLFRARLQSLGGGDPRREVTLEFFRELLGRQALGPPGSLRRRPRSRLQDVDVDPALHYHRDSPRSDELEKVTLGGGARGPKIPCDFVWRSWAVLQNLQDSFVGRLFLRGHPKVCRIVQYDADADQGDMTPVQRTGTCRRTGPQNICSVGKTSIPCSVMR